MAGWPSRRVRQSQVQNWHAWKEEEEKSWPATIRQEMMKNVYYHHHNKKMEKRKKTDRGKRQRRTLHFIPFFYTFRFGWQYSSPSNKTKMDRTSETVKWDAASTTWYVYVPSEIVFCSLVLLNEEAVIVIITHFFLLLFSLFFFYDKVVTKVAKKIARRRKVNIFFFLF